MKFIGLTQRVEYLKDRRERRDCLDQAWIKLLNRIGLTAIPLPNTATNVDNMIRQLKLSGVILTGGNDLSHLPKAAHTAPERDKLEKKLLSSCLKRNIPLLGVCRGFQLMVSHYGGKLVRVPGHAATKHKLYICQNSVMPLKRRSSVNSFHHFGVNSVGKNLNIIAKAPDGTIEAVAHKHSRQWGIMWHPERGTTNTNDLALLKDLFL